MKLTANSKILIANRGEIAVRVIATARALGYATVAVYSAADDNALHVRSADQAVAIGAAAVADSYLNSSAIIAAAKASGADAIHPGYGFLSENAEFARLCEANGIVFIGPPSDAIALMGSKQQSKLAMQAAGVPCLPGYNGDDQRDDALVAAASEVGYPLMVKASAGGGGRGMRLVAEPTALPAALQTARSEALSAFGDGQLILERAVLEPRHIEIQVFADDHGNVVHLGERDCSIQRRHQKVVEEAPSPFVSPALRQAMGDAAVMAARACDYRGAGTVEFLVDGDGQFYFLEMNTRLQVEHPVTELVTGQDLVAWQLQVAAGEPLPLSQAQIGLSGHAIEVRLYAEEPRQQFMPQTGSAALWGAAKGEGVRIDSGIACGAVVSPHYDPMLGKLIAHGSNREQARRRLIAAIKQSPLLGVANNRQFLVNILSHPCFIDGAATTAFIADQFNADPTLQPLPPSPAEQALAALLYWQRSASQHHSALRGFSNASAAVSQFSLACEHGAAQPSALTLTVSQQHGDASFTVAGAEFNQPLTVLEIGEQSVRYQLGGDSAVAEQRYYCWHNQQLWLDGEHGTLCFSDTSAQPASSADTLGNGQITASMDGAIVAIAVAVGQPVSRGDTLLVLEAMKMEHPLKADSDGIVESINVSVGSQVKGRQLLATLTPHSGE